MIYALINKCASVCHEWQVKNNPTFSKTNKYITLNNLWFESINKWRQNQLWRPLKMNLLLWYIKQNEVSITRVFMQTCYTVASFNFRLYLTFLAHPLLGQRTLNVPGITQYHWVPAKLGCFEKHKFCCCYFGRPIYNRFFSYSVVLCSSRYA